MIFLNFLRFLGDAAVYYAFAGAFSVCFGGGNTLPGLLIPAACYGLSALLRGKKPRYLLLIPCLLCLLPLFPTADRVLALPPVLYAALLMHRDGYELSAYRQSDVFGFFWKAYPVFYLLFAVIGGWSILNRASLPAAVTAAAVSVFLMRVLRHDPEIYLQPRFLLRNAVPLGALGVFAWVLSIPEVVRVLKTALYAVYSVTIVPLFLGLGYVMGWIFMHTLYPLLKWLTSLIGREEEEQQVELTTGSFADTMQSDGDPNPAALLVVKIIACVAVVVLVLFLLFLLYRKLAGDRDENARQPRLTERRGAVTEPLSREERGLFGRDPVTQVRRQYRQYLKLCREKGFAPPDSYTTEDIHRHTAGLFPDPEQAAELRQIYLQARYHRSASPADAARAKELVRMLKGGKQGEGNRADEAVN